ncbi:sodium:calcium antiporter [Paraglaciecola arctica]|uniref:sodium:calcium antiporter n=1 Tax=Paraglaciecola arctica TaxID=1128911 RepID=UPI001C07D95C|nr:sodium:calcium antiporter [Paraglaciecola arctica]
MFLELAYLLFVMTIAAAIVWKACNYLEDACHELALYYGLPDSVKGSTVMAISSSFPELVTIILAAGIHGDFELGLATIIGSAVFNILVIPGMSVLFRKGPLKAGRDLIYREAQFYLISVLIIMLTLSLALIYNPLPNTPMSATLSTSMMFLPLLFYVLYIYIQYQEVSDHKTDKKNRDIPLLKSWAKLLISMMLVTISVEVLIQMVIKLGEMFDTPSYFWGATILAAATSIPDLFVSVKAAKRKVNAASLTNAFGSNVFDLLVVLPVGVLVTGTVVFSFPNVLPMLVFLLGATVFFLVVARNGSKLTNNNGKILLLAYCAFIIWMGFDNLVI